VIKDKKYPFIQNHRNKLLLGIIAIPAAATTASLVFVGLFMISPIKEIDFGDFTEAIPAFLTIIMMPLAYSISDGIIFGIISYVLLKIFTGKARCVNIATYIVAAFFIVKFFI
jgi:AGZA family xanthine/uracil permease-like MFS transporter